MGKFQLEEHLQKQKELKFTICTKRNQKVHGLRNWKEMFRLVENRTVIICRDKNTNKLLGQIAIELNGDEAWLFFLSVNPKFRGNGIGTELIHKAEKFIAKKGIRKIFLRPQKEFEKKLIPWYESLGYEKLYRDKACENEWKMKKAIYDK